MGSGISNGMYVAQIGQVATTVRPELGGLSLVAETTVSGGAVTSVTFSGLDLATDAKYRIIMNIDNATGNLATLGLFYNGDTTDTNYYTGGIGGATGNTAQFITLQASMSCYAAFDVFPTPNIANAKALGLVSQYEAGTVIGGGFSSWWTNTANVTSITILSTFASAIANNSKITLYKYVV